MVAPLLPDLAIAPLQAIDEASLTHRAYRGVLTSVRGPGGVYTQTWVYSTNRVAARLNPLALDSPLRADQPSSARKWQLALAAGTVTKAGERWRVTGKTGGEAWTRTVSVDEVLFPRSDELSRRTLCSDVEANPA